MFRSWTVKVSSSRSFSLPGLRGRVDSMSMPGTLSSMNFRISVPILKWRRMS